MYLGKGMIQPDNYEIPVLRRRPIYLRRCYSQSVLINEGEVGVRN